MDAESKKWDARYVISVILAVVTISASWFAIIVASTRNSNRAASGNTTAVDDAVDIQRVGTDYLGYISVPADWTRNPVSDNYESIETQVIVYGDDNDESASLSHEELSGDMSLEDYVDFQANKLKKEGYAANIKSMMIGDKSGFDLSYMDGRSSLRIHSYYFLAEEYHMRIITVIINGDNEKIASSIRDSWSETTEAPVREEAVVEEELESVEEEAEE